MSDAAAVAKHMAELSGSYRRVFEAPEGQAVLADLLEQGRVLGIVHTPGDAYETAYREGRRSLAIYIVNVLGWSPGELRKLAESRTAQHWAMQMRRDDGEEAA